MKHILLIGAIAATLIAIVHQDRPQILLTATMRAATPAPLQGTAPIREQIVQYALSRQGDPYVSGARAEGGSDCSGFVQVVYRTVAGIDPGYTTFDQWPRLTHIDERQVQPGDLWYGRWNDSGSWDSEHVGIVADLNGDGKLDLIHNGADVPAVHVTYAFLETYLGQHTLGFADVLASPR